MGQKPSAVCGSPPRAWGLAYQEPACYPIERFTPTGVGTGTFACASSSGLAVHPHGRGDWENWHLLDDQEAGSPPRAWGLEAIEEAFSILARFTPTGVGTGSYAKREKGRWSVHPHGRGDWNWNPENDASWPGSPPRAWGLGDRHRCIYPDVRFTPTGVGTGIGKNLDAVQAAVHPHGRGDWRSSEVVPSYSRGSPPRAWGLAFTLTTRANLPRFTPTGVGTGLFSSEAVS